MEKGIESELSNKADIEELKRLETEIEKLEKALPSSIEETYCSIGKALYEDETSQKLNVYLIIGAIFLFNILALFFIVLSPVLSAPRDLETLSWTFLLPLLVIMIVNIGSTIVFCYQTFDKDGMGRTIFSHCAAVILLIADTIGIWFASIYDNQFFVICLAAGYLGMFAHALSYEVNDEHSIWCNILILASAAMYFVDLAIFGV